MTTITDWKVGDKCECKRPTGGWWRGVIDAIQPAHQPDPRGTGPIMMIKLDGGSAAFPWYPHELREPQEPSP